MIYSLSNFQVYNTLSLNIITTLYIISPEFMYLISVSLYLLTTWYTMCFSFVYLFCKNVCSGPLPIFNQTSNNSSSSIFYCRVIYCCNVLWTLIAHQMCGLEIFSLNMVFDFLFFDFYLCCNRNLLVPLVHFAFFALALRVISKT